MMKSLIAIGLASLAAVARAGADDPQASGGVCKGAYQTLVRDVAIIGGGSAGTYAAIHLGGMNKSVAVVEPHDYLGGHFETYTDPSGTHVDYGIQILYNTTEVREFFDHFNIPLAPFVPPTAAATVYANFKTGTALQGFNFTANLTNYFAVRDKYPSLLYGDSMKAPLPADYTLKFSDFIKKYNLQDEAFYAYNTPASGGLANILDADTLSVFKALDQVVQQQTVQKQAVRTAAHDFGAAFVAAQAELGSNALLSSKVVDAQRTTSGVKLCVKGPKGYTNIQASKLLITMTPTASNMAPFHPVANESRIFNQFQSYGYYTGLINNTGFPSFYNFQNADASRLYSIPHFPTLYHFLPTSVDGLFSWWYSGDSPVDEFRVHSDVIAAAKRLANSSSSNPQIVAYASHTPYNLHPSSSAVNHGFWSDFANLQGLNSTYYTGATVVYSSAAIWAFTSNLLSSIGL